MKEATKRPISIGDIADEMSRTVAAVHGIEDVVRGAGDLQGVDMSGACTLLEMLVDRIQKLATELHASSKAA